MRTQKSDKYNPLLMTLHWLTLILLIGAYAAIELRGLFPLSIRDTLKSVHYACGVLVFIVTPIRLILHFLTPTPLIAPACSAGQMFLAKTMEYVLYLFLLAMPTLGYLAINAYGGAVPLFGMDLPVLINNNPELGERLGKMHSLIGRIGYILIGVHAGAALFHHYVQRDNTLRRMLWR